VRPRELFELADHLLVTAECKVCLEPVFQRGEPQLVEPPDLLLRERLVGEVGEGRSPPESERLLQPPRSAGRLRRTRLLDECLKPPCVDALVVDAEGVPGHLRHEHAVAELPAEPGDVPLHVLRRGGRRLLAPQLVHERVDRDDRAAVQEQDGQQRTGLARGKLEQLAVPADLERPEDPELERLAHRRSTGVNRSSTAGTDDSRRRERRARTGQA
jgi:hypothetical protein